MNLIGREEEKKLIKTLVKNEKSNLLTIVGRRRIGKTFLVKTLLKDHINFSFVGTQHEGKKNQLKKFGQVLDEYLDSPVASKTPESWSEAFRILTQYLDSSKNRKKIVFFDEFPWIDSHKSGFLNEFSYWWNSWATNQNILVIICGSSASWMYKKVINNKGGLHNRVTKKIFLKPFTLGEVKKYLDHRKIDLGFHQIIQLYMVTGGVPFYLDDVERGESVTQMIDRMCFNTNGLLSNEFNNLYASLFDNASKHIEVIRTLAKKNKGLTRKEIIQNTSLRNGGGLTTVLEELTDSDFVIEIFPFAKKKKEKLYRLVDEYTLFYLKFMEGRRRGIGSWITLSQSNSYKTWCGYAFENICIKHSKSILISMGLGGLQYELSSYVLAGNDDREGMQIDMLLDRADQTINLCEVKYYNAEWAMTKKQSLQLLNRKEQFRSVNKSKKTLINTVISVYGLKQNAHSLNSVDKEITAENLFSM